MKIGKSVAEFLGTYIFLFVILLTGCGWSIGLTLSIMIYLFGKISGGNFNPAVTIMMVLGKKQPKSDLVSYIIAQILGGVAALYTYKLLKSHKLI
jgi:aquaporin Z